MHGDSSTVRRGRPFAKGYDPRRHQFTAEECRAGFYAVLASIATRNLHATLYNVMDYFIARRAALKGAA